MENISSKSTAGTLSRRVLLGGMAAIAIEGCGCTYDGFGAPYQDPDHVDARFIRATLAVWLLFVTNGNFAPIGNDGTLSLPEQFIHDVANDLKYLIPGSSTVDQRKQLIQHLIAGINGTAPIVVKLTKDGKQGETQTVSVNLTTALLVMQNLFNQFMHGAFVDGITPSVEAAYPTGACPGDVKEILSIANNKPTASNPSVLLPKNSQ